jgi:CheY-like chemotaxis protein
MARILVIDDDKTIRCLLRAGLELAGHEVVEAKNGSEGLQHYQAAPTAVVITDMQMPVMDGIQLLIELQRIAPRVQVIALSGGRGYLERARALNAQRTFEKPFHLHAVLDAVQELASAPVSPTASYTLCDR